MIPIHLTKNEIRDSDRTVCTKARIFDKFKKVCVGNSREDTNKYLYEGQSQEWTPPP